MLTRGKKAAIVCITGLLLVAAIYCFGQLFWPIELIMELRHDTLKRERALLYQTDQAALAAELRKFASHYRWSLAPAGDEPTIFWPNDPAMPQSLKILQPTSIAVFDDWIMFERGGPPHHFGIVVFRQGAASDGHMNDALIDGQLLKQLQPGVWFYSDHRKLPRP
jgi:hypothetical protein